MSGMIALVKALAVQEGYNLTALPDVRILRADRPLARTPVLYDPGIVIVCGQQTRFSVSRPICMMNSTIWPCRFRCRL